MASAVQVFKESMIQRDMLTAAMGTLTKDFGQMMGGVLAQLSDSSDNMRGAAQAMSEDASRTQAGAEETSVIATRSAQNLSAVAATTEELAASVQEIGR